MSVGREDGYILASAIAALLAISIVAAALIGASGDALAASRRAEADAVRSAILQSALRVVGTQLVLEPRRRQIDLEGRATIDVLGHAVAVEVSWEARKLDINRTEPDAIRELLDDQQLDPDFRSKAVAMSERRQAAAAPLRLLSDLGLNRSEEDCLAEWLTVFGGMTEYDPAIAKETVQIGRPAAGSRLTVRLALKDAAQDGLAAVILMTRNPTDPFKILDWRPTSRLAGDPCNVA